MKTLVLLLGAVLSVGMTEDSHHVSIHLKATPLVAFAPAGIELTAWVPLDSAAYQATIVSEAGSSTWLVDPNRKLAWVNRTWRTLPIGQYTISLVVLDKEGKYLGTDTVTVQRLDPHGDNP